MRTRLQELRWILANKGRALLGRPPQPRPCCQQAENLGPREAFTPGTTVRRCRECGSRHFEAIVDPGRLRIRTTA